MALDIGIAMPIQRESFVKKPEWGLNAGALCLLLLLYERINL